MHNGVKNTFIFVLGAAVGAAVSWKILKKKYEQIAQEEIDSVKEFYANRNKASEKESEVEQSVNDDTAEKNLNVREYAAILATEGYTNYSNVKEQEVEPMLPEEVKSKADEPYVITPEDFGEYDEYDTVCYTYYSDGVLTDDYDERIENVNDIIGLDALTRFGEFADDAVYVRNDRLKTDYEVLYDSSTYEDAMGRNM